VYDIGQAPSVTTWLRRVRGPDTDRDPEVQPAVLAFADPDIEATAGDAERRAADPWLEGVRLGALPHARSEARTMVRALGGESLLLTGPDASERFLKQADLDRFAIVHFAAHALVDPERPERSAVVLAPGGENEDGFLQIREIVDLDLRGKVIVLSACRSASGTVLKGEGLLGLGRAFFRAGARAVVGNLWPMRDDEAEAFVRRLSRRLVAGDTLAGSIAAVRRRRMEAGAPADAWAGVVVLGDGDFRPVPDGRVRSRRGAVWTLGAIGAALVLAAWVLAYRRHRR
jgi:CHAT domain-containing protein